MTEDPTRAHYDGLLAPIYRWMLDDMPSAFARSRGELEACGIGAARAGARGLDLGAGLGLQTIPLAEAGYLMTAIDSSRELLAELSCDRPDVPVILGDLCDFRTVAPGPYDVIVCMGDTLPHLPSEQAVARLLADACAELRPGGSLVLTLRDYASRPLEGAERFVLVRADERRILTCFLDYTPDRVCVTDLVHELGSTGWSFRASSYPKLRLASDWVRGCLEAQGCTVTRATTASGRITIVARRAA